MRDTTTRASETIGRLGLEEISKPRPAEERRPPRGLAAVVLALAASCGSELATDAGAPIDAGAADAARPDDAGTTRADASPATSDAASADAGSRSDTGDVDAGSSDASPPSDAGSLAGDGGVSRPGAAPRAVDVARATSLPACTVFVDAANAGAADGTALGPHRTIAAAIRAAGDDAVICVAEGVYPEALLPGDKAFTLAGGFQSGSGFRVRDSARYVSRAQGDGTNTFLKIEDPGPAEGKLTAVDGFEISGYSQAIVRELWYSQRFELTNNFIHDNRCARPDAVGAGFSLDNVTGAITGNVLESNSCSRGGGGALFDSTSSNSVSVTHNRVESNSGTEPGISHGGGLYLFGAALRVTANAFIDNRATGWGGGLYIGAWTGGGQPTTAELAWNVYRNNRADIAGGGFFCDDSARCTSSHEVYAQNCGGNILLDSGPDDAEPTRATFDHLTCYRGLTPDCSAPGASVLISKANPANDTYSFSNSIFWGNETDIDASCDSGCGALTVQVRYSNIRPSGRGFAITFGPGNQDGVDPLFVGAEANDFHLSSTHGHWTPSGYVVDPVDSPALAAGDPSAPARESPPRAGVRIELGAFGNSPEASNVR